MYHKLAFVFVCSCILTLSLSRPSLGAEHLHDRNPKFDSAHPEWIAQSPEIGPGTSSTAAPTPKEENSKHIDQQCSWDIAVANVCQPPPGSALSAFPRVSYPDPQ